MADTFIPEPKSIPNSPEIIRMRNAALYVHIPFCVRKCAYCDFVSFPGCLDKIDAYLDALGNEARMRRDLYGPIKPETLFVGGGTPSIMTPRQIFRLSDILRNTFDLSALSEATYECNPGTLTREKLRALRECGVSRLSIGVQSFDDRLLKLLGRIHTADQAKENVLLASDEGFYNISVDLMFALPDQTVDDFEVSLEIAAALPVRHISCYSLIVEEDTPIKRLQSERPEAFPGEDTALEMQRLCSRFLVDHGFRRYEISNYALPGYECRHNLTYWRRGDYLGLGVAAHSLMNGRRFSNTESLHDYISGVTETDSQILSERDVYEETVMLGLRTDEGVDQTILPPGPLSRLVAQGLMSADGNRARVTERGADVLNAIIIALI